MPVRSRKKSSKPKLWIIGCVILVVLIAAGIFFFVTRDDKMSPPADTTSNNIDYTPATDEEKADSDRQKEVDADRDNTPPSSNVMPVIVDASQYGDQIEVRSYVPGVIEDGGTCTVKITKGQTTVNKQTTAVADATTTSCGLVSFTRNQFDSAGKWTVTVSYSSPTHNGTSAEATIDIQ